jgi:type II secretory pathway component PulF
MRKVTKKFLIFSSHFFRHVSHSFTEVSSHLANFNVLYDKSVIYMQSLEALQDGEHEKQRRNILYFLLHQVTRSSNFSALMRKNATKVSLCIFSFPPFSYFGLTDNGQ